MAQPAMEQELSHQIQSVTDQLIGEFRDRVAPDQVERCCQQHFERLHDGRVKTFVPTLVYRYSRAELTTQAAENHASEV